MIKLNKLLSLVLALCMLSGITAAFAEAPVEAETAETDIPLVVAISTLSQKFSPFYADTGYDQDVVGMTQLGMMTTDRVGGIIYNGIEGETYTDVVEAVIEATGQQILDALELSSAVLPGASTAFLQVSGLIYSVDLNYASNIITDNDGGFAGVDGTMPP